MIVTRSFSNQFWTDLNSPTKDEIDSLVLAQNINPLIAKDLLSPTPMQHAICEDSIIYAVLHIPVFKHSHAQSDSQEIDFLITRDGVVTTRYDSIDSLHHLAKEVEVEEILNKSDDSHIFFRIVTEIYKSVEDELAYMEGWMKSIEKNIFAGKEVDMVFAISSAGRNLLNFKRIMEPHGRVLDYIKESSGGKFEPVFEREVRTVIERWRHIMKRVDAQLDMINEMRETNNSMLSTKQNEIMKIFTIMAFVTFPLSLVASIFGMNTSFIPVVGWPYDFWIVMGIMFMMSLAMFTFFKYKKWI